MKFGSKRATFEVILGGFEGFGPCLGVNHPTHPHLGEISQKKTVFFWQPPLAEVNTSQSVLNPHIAVLSLVGKDMVAGRC